MDKFQSFLYDTLMLKAQEYPNGVQDILDKPLVFAQIVNQSTAFYCIFSLSEKNDNEEIIRLYAYQLIAQILKNKDTQSVYNFLKTKKTEKKTSTISSENILKSDSPEIIKAIIKNDYKTFKKLVADHKHVNCYDTENGYSPLVLALINQNHPLYIKDLLDANVPVEEIFEGDTPLIIAIKNEHELAAAILIKYGANRGVKTGDDKDIVTLAMTYDCPRIFNFLFKKDIVVIKKPLMGEITYMHYAAQYGFIDIVENLLQKGISANLKVTKRYTPLMSAARNGQLETVKLLLKSGAKVNLKSKEKRTALMYASENGYSDVVQTLIDAGADIHAQTRFDNMTALLYAAKNGNQETLKTLFNAGAVITENTDVYTGNMSPLMLVCNHFKTYHTQNCVDRAKVLIEAGDDINRQNNKGKTPLIYAAQSDYVQMVDFFVKAGANPYITDEDNMSALSYAIKYKHTEIFHLLINSMSLTQKELNTHFYEAVLYDNCSSVVKKLIRKGVDINGQDKHIRYGIERVFNECTPNLMLVETLIDENINIFMTLTDYLERREKPLYQMFEEIVQTQNKCSNEGWDKTIAQRIQKKIQQKITAQSVCTRHITKSQEKQRE